MRNTQKVRNRKTQIEWGDCHPAHIVYYPRYFAYFDACTTALFKKAGLSKREMLKTYRIIGLPLVEVQASFRAPSRFSEAVLVESEITHLRRSSFDVRHRLFNKGIVAVECVETRVWACRSASDPDKIESEPIPQEVIQILSNGSKAVRKEAHFAVRGHEGSRPSGENAIRTNRR